MSIRNSLKTQKISLIPNPRGLKYNDICGALVPNNYKTPLLINALFSHHNHHKIASLWYYVFLTLISQHIGVETQEVGAEVDPALVWHSSSPVAAREIRHKLLSLRQTEQTLKAQHSLPEAFGILLVTGWCALFCYQTLYKHNIPPLNQQCKTGTYI